MSFPLREFLADAASLLLPPLFKETPSLARGRTSPLATFFATQLPVVPGLLLVPFLRPNLFCCKPPLSFTSPRKPPAQSPYYSRREIFHVLFLLVNGTLLPDSLFLYSSSWFPLLDRSFSPFRPVGPFLGHPVDDLTGGL